MANQIPIDSLLKRWISKTDIGIIAALTLFFTVIYPLLSPNIVVPDQKITPIVNSYERLGIKNYAFKITIEFYCKNMSVVTGRIDSFDVFMTSINPILANDLDSYEVRYKRVEKRRLKPFRTEKVRLSFVVYTNHRFVEHNTFNIVLFDNHGHKIEFNGVVVHFMMK